MLRNFRRIALTVLLAAAGLKGLYHLVAQAWFFSQGAHAGDAMYYWTMGRGILNGLTPYVDIFETKPPGVFLLSALSLAITGGGAIGHWLDALITLAIPVIIVWTSVSFSSDLELTQRERRLMTTASALFGMCLALYMGYHGEGWQTEWYGGFFGIIYMACALTIKDHPWKTPVLLGMPMLLSVGFKEPLFLSLLGAALVILPDRATFVKRFGIPALIVTAAGTAALVILGYAQGFFGMYLPSQFGHHIARSVPLPLRGFQIDLVTKYLSEFSYGFVVLVILLFGIVLRNRYRTGGWKPVLPVLLALYVATLGATIRGYPAGNHFATLAPFLAALFFVVMREGRRNMIAACAALAAVTLLLLPLRDGFPAYARRLADMRAGDAASRETAARIDAILDACNVDRYFFVEGRPYMPFTRHSPKNFFVYVGPEAVVYHHPLIIEKQLEAFSDADIVVAEGDAYEIRTRPEEKLLSEQTFRYLANHFTITPRSCAAGLPTPEGYSVLYRRDPNEKKPFPYRMQE